MALIRSIEEMQACAKLNGTIQYDSLKPYIEQATLKYIKPVIGQALIDTIEEYLDSDPEEIDEDIIALLAKIRVPLTNFSILQGFGTLNIQVTEAGFAIINNQNLAPASKERVEDYKNNLIENAYEGEEQLLIFLEENAADYDDWTGSAEYTEHYSVFIRTATEFNKWVNIGKSRAKFVQFRQTMKNIEMLEIESVISKALCDAIKAEIIDGDVEAENLLILDSIKAAIANFVAATEINEQKYKALAQQYLGKVQRIIDATPDDYPEYSESDLYEADKDTYNRFENNDEDSKIFVFSSPYKQ